MQVKQGKDVKNKGVPDALKHNEYYQTMKAREFAVTESIISFLKAADAFSEWASKSVEAGQPKNPTPCNSEWIDTKGLSKRLGMSVSTLNTRLYVLRSFIPPELMKMWRRPGGDGYFYKGEAFVAWLKKNHPDALRIARGGGSHGSNT